MTDKESCYSENFEDYGSAIASMTPCCNNPNTYLPIADSTTYLRDDLTQQVLEELRPAYALPKGHHAIMCRVQKVYKEEGVVRNTIDLMGDFTCLGIRLSHPNANIQKFYRNWFEVIKGVDRSERFAHNLYKFGVAIVTRGSREFVRRKKTYTLPDGYRFINPEAVYDINGKEAIATNKPIRYGVLKDTDSILKLDLSENDLVPLPPEQTIVFHYKKDDWQIWATPIIYSILRDVAQLQMYRKADFTTLEGAASPVRVWKLGDFEYKIVPNDAAFTKLRQMMQVNTGHGIRDIMWGPDIELIETKQDNYAILGEEKYRPTLSAIYVGLGIPPTLTGSAVGGSGTTNNLVSLKTLIGRLEYGRQKLIEFWNNEIKIVQETMGFRYPAVIEFDYPDMGDEAAEKKLWIDLADRNLISDEWLQEKFKSIPFVESSRINRDYTDRRKFRRAPKGGPWHDPQIIEKYEQALLEAGKITPSQIGVIFPESDGDGDFWEDDIENEGAEDEVEVSDDEPSDQLSKPRGRPKNSVDTKPRKRRRFVPRTRAVIWGTAAQQAIANIVVPLALQHFDKSNLRQLSDEEFDTLEKMKFNALLGLDLFAEVTPETIKGGVYSDNNEVYDRYQNIVREIEYNRGSSLTVDEKRRLQLEVYLDAIYS